MPKKINTEELEELAQKLIAADRDSTLGSLGPFKEQRKSVKTPIEKLKNYTYMVSDSVFWASRQAY